MPPTIGNGKICYLEIPATDVNMSSSFYQNVFGWKMRKRGDGRIAFDDGVGEVSGAFVPDRPVSKETGLLIYVMVDSVENTIRSIQSNGGKIVQPVGQDAPEITARFSDPEGNILGLYQEPSMKQG